MDAKRRLNNILPMKWRENEVMSLLKLYKQNECLWNNKTPEYRNKYVRDKAYNQIIQSLGLDVTVADVRKKIKGLRTTYNDELNKISNSVKNGAVGDRVYRPSVFWFELVDSFLREVAESRKGEVIWNKAPIEREDTPTEEASYSAPVILPDYQDDEDEDDGNSGDAHNDSFYFETPEAEPLPTRKKTASPKMDVQKRRKEKNNKEDEIDLFGRFVVLQLRKLPEMAGLEIMQEFHKLLIKARKAHESGKSIEGESSFGAISSSGNSKRKKKERVYKIESHSDPLDESD